MSWSGSCPCAERIPPRKTTAASIVLVALGAVGVAGCASTPAEAPTGPRTVTLQELTVEAPAGWKQILEERKTGIQFFRKTREHRGTSVSIWPVNVPSALRHLSPAEHARGYFAAERGLPRHLGRWEGWQEGEREIDRRRYPVMGFRVVHPPQRDVNPAATGLFLLYFPDDLDVRQRFYVVMWQDNHAVGEVAKGLEALDAFVKTIRLGPVER